MDATHIRASWPYPRVKRSGVDKHAVYQGDTQRQCGSLHGCGGERQVCSFLRY
jgi:hypothetical protein